MCEVNWEIIVNLLGIFVNVSFGIWIVKALQSRLNNERVIKDHFINEVKDLRVEYKSFLSAIYSGTKQHGQIIPTFRLLGIKLSDLMAILENQFEIDKDFLNPYTWELNTIVTDDATFISIREENKNYKPTPETCQKLMKFQGDNSHLFNELIIQINQKTVSKRNHVRSFHWFSKIKRLIGNIKP